MGDRTLNENKNVYFQARKRASVSNPKLFSRESAAEMLGISPILWRIMNLEAQR